MKTRRHAVTCLSGITLAIALSLTPAAELWADSPKAAAPPAAMAAAQSAYGHLPLSFEANQGQTDSRVNYRARGQGYTLLLTPNEAVLALCPPAPHSSASPSPSPNPLRGEGRDEGTMLRLQLLGVAHTSTLRGLNELPGKANYFIGNNPEKWRTNVPTFAKVRQPQVYPGIDLVYYGNQRQLEFDFVVAPGADPAAIQFAIDGADEMALVAEDLVIQAGGETIRLHQPVIWQEIGGAKQRIAGSYILLPLQKRGSLGREQYQIAFHVDAYDTSRSLVIDPVLSYSTYLGGSSLDSSTGLTVDVAGNAYVVGGTASPNFPTPPGVVQATFGDFDVFVAKLNPTGTALAYTTFLGGNGPDLGLDIVLDTSGNAYVVGSTSSPNFPVTPGVVQPTYGGGGDDAFVAKLSPTGAALVYSTYLGGSQSESSFGLAIDTAGNAYVTGATSSIDFPTTPGVVGPTYSSGVFDAFVAKLTPTGTALAYATYLGGRNLDVGQDIAVDASGNVYVVGRTTSPNFPTTSGTLQPTFGGDQDAFVAKLTPTGAALVYATYLGGSGVDQGNSIAIDASGNVYITGITDSPNFHVTPGVVQPTYGGGGDDAFVAKLSPTGAALVYATYLGGSGEDLGSSIAVDGVGNVYVSGSTGSLNFPTTPGAVQPTSGGGGFVAKLTPTGKALTFATFLEGGQCHGLAIDAVGNAYLSGETSSTNFPTTPGVIQPTRGGGFDAFVAKITTNVPFAAFRAEAEIDLRHRPHHDDFDASQRTHDDDLEVRYRGHDDEFEMTATFTLGPNTNGIAPLTEAVTVQVGTFSTTIPAGSFRLKKGRFTFEGVISGVRLEAVLRSLILGNDYEFTVEGKGADLTGTENPVTVGLTIGDDSGSKTITAKFE